MYLRTLVLIIAAVVCLGTNGTAADDSFLGRWKLNPEKSQLSAATDKTATPAPMTIQITSWHGDDYCMLNPSDESELTFRLDRKDYPAKGPQIAEGMTVSGERRGDFGITLIHKVKGRTVQTDQWDVSSDGKTLTGTITYARQTTAEVRVFDRLHL